MGDFETYLAMEETLQIVNREYISLSPEEMRKYNKILDELLNQIIEMCKESNNLFKYLYRKIFYGGSYYDGLKIRRPDEYDIHVKLYIPKKYNNYTLFSSDKSGFVHVQFSEYDNILNRLVDHDGFLDTQKVMLWMHQILSTWLKGRKRNKARVNWKNTSVGRMWVKLKRHGPAFTFRVTNFDDIVLNFDFVPCFLFGNDDWPDGFRRNMIYDKPEFYIVPKPPKGIPRDRATQYWRTSFQEQDRSIIHSRERLKPALRLIKKLRDKLGLENIICSYFIKNLFLFEVFEREPEFWNLPLSYVFMKMLEVFYRSIRSGEIICFWHNQFNLLEDIEEETLNEIRDILENIISNINNDPDDKYLVCRYLLSRKEWRDFRAEHME